MYHWDVQKQNISSEFVKAIQKDFPPILANLLWNRKVEDIDKARKFLKPDYQKDLYDPYLMKGMDRVVKRIFRAVKKQEKIAIFGDYDVDGICSALILEITLKKLGANLLDSAYFPDRDKEGYGLNEQAINYLIDQKKADLIISVDCGISNLAESKLIKNKKKELIICDHHDAPAILPKTPYILDPWQKGDKYPFKSLCAAGVVFKLSQALISQARENKIVDIKTGFLRWILDLVALATVADVVSLIDENRVLVKYGLIVLRKTRRYGLLELIKKAKLESRMNNLAAFDIGYILAPRINAAGRIKHASLSYKLLRTNDIDQAQQLAEEIEMYNHLRQKISQEKIKEVENKISSNKKLESIIFEGGENWPVGILGLIAGHFTQKYYRPTFIFSQKGDICKASARGIKEIHLVKILEEVKDLLLGYGGHKKAAGFSFLTKDKSKLRDKIKELVNNLVKGVDLKPTVRIDSIISPEEIGWDLAETISLMAPFGESNPSPVFLVKNLKVINQRLVGNGEKHLKLNLFDEEKGYIFKAIGFNLSNLTQKYLVGDNIDIVFELMPGEFNGFKELSLKIIDLRKANSK
ncbi:MAG TPA: single-stranded-DNA-specific exonuclease RecJ [Candidatus Portnoybacteria bacterium]|nr:single-stranded-DNA-specific exonuclease RecJ [Candidatus Portnoybacteria bacterium]